MTPAQKIALRLSEVRQRLNEISGIEGDAFTDEIRQEADTLQTEYGDLEIRHRAAIVAEGEAETRAADRFGDMDGEDRELAELRGKARLGAYVEAALEMRSVIDGAEAELNAALEIPAGRFPLELLAPPAEARTEHRATTDIDAGAQQRTWLDRLFSETAAMHLGITFQSVAPGVSAHPVTTAGASAAQRGRREAADDAAWTVGVAEIKPTRNTVRAVFSEEDAARLPGLESALRRDLSMALAEGVDRSIFLGDSGANEDGADITGLITATGVTDLTLTQAAKVKPADVVAAFVGLIDGKHARSLQDLRVVATVGANTLWAGRTIGLVDFPAATLAGFLGQHGMRWAVRGDIETATAAGDWGAFIGRGRGIAGAGVAAIWNSGMILRDPYSGAAKGEVALTLSHLWGFKLPRPSNFARLKFVA